MNTTKTKPLRECRECAEPLPAMAKASACFCGDRCKAAWNNRRKTRGADLYDLWMTMRYRRDDAKELKVWKEMCRLSEKWNEEDRAADRVSFERADIVLTRLKDTGRLVRARKIDIGIRRRA